MTARRNFFPHLKSVNHRQRKRKRMPKIWWNWQNSNIVYTFTCSSKFCWEAIIGHMATAAAPLTDETSKTFTLLWFDSDTSRAQWYLNARKRLRSIIDCIETFEDRGRCEEYIQQYIDRCHHLVIVGHEAALQLVSSIHNYQQVVSIYVYELDPTVTNTICTDRYPKVSRSNHQSCTRLFCSCYR